MSKTSGNLLASSLRSSQGQKLNSIIRTRDDMIKAQISGTKFKDLSEMRNHGLLKSYDNVQANLSRSRISITSNTNSENVLNIVSAHLGYFHDLILEVNNFVSSIDATKPKEIITANTSDYFERIAGILNQQNPSVGYIFGGAMKHLPPIENIDNFVQFSNIINNQATANYTDVVDQYGSIILNNAVSLDGDINASNICFCEFIASLHLIKDLNTDNYASKQKIFQRLESSMRALSITTAKISQYQRTIDTENVRLGTDIASSTSIYDNTFRHNPVEGFVEQQQNTADMQAMTSNLKTTMQNKFEALRKLYEV